MRSDVSEICVLFMYAPETHKYMNKSFYTYNDVTDYPQIAQIFGFRI